jgi:hypothetical protein
MRKGDERGTKTRIAKKYMHRSTRRGKRDEETKTHLDGERSADKEQERPLIEMLVPGTGIRKLLPLVKCGLAALN